MTKVEHPAAHGCQRSQAERECDPQHHNALTGSRIVIVAHDPCGLCGFDLVSVHIWTVDHGTLLSVQQSQRQRVKSQPFAASSYWCMYVLIFLKAFSYLWRAFSPN